MAGHNSNPKDSTYFIMDEAVRHIKEAGLHLPVILRINFIIYIYIKGYMVIWLQW